MTGGRRGQLETSGLRPGWTTGACATAAATAAYVALVGAEFPDPVVVRLPQGRTPAFALTRHHLDRDDNGRVVAATAAVTKDAGDDPDVTHGAVVEVTVRSLPTGEGVVFRAGPGVGTITRAGLQLTVGEPAINPAPRAMIRDNLAVVAGGRTPDLEVSVGIVDGEELASHTLNGRLGIVGGLSVLGTTGVVIPYSCSAWIDSIRLGIDVARARGLTHVAATTGSTSERTVRDLYRLPEVGLLDMGDFAGAVLKHLRRHPVERLTLCGGFAKFAKLADGHLDLHSGRSRLDLSFLGRLAAVAGADPGVAEAVAASGTGLQALHVATAAGVPLGDAVALAARDQAKRILDEAPVRVDVVCVDRAGAVVGRCAPA
ncbi:cobalt-precorrin-5B (C(1))-methyltransferase [Raineyella fluvialis]|uniref:Cobalt-precorrin-5B C(1)-methyltransferase n=1 Tax=Raineyella fluvialis TaxID=2662261 RepID=A0A5Q2FDX2_9ACTN|nr:cobalt-precorrin-5B (C(1))-methyltransferase [Raineyella fluvialis]QGF22915.1 cobalt-precorrin-5B (C(1))-methyltransferase [Raineyella fluvialis]